MNGIMQSRIRIVSVVFLVLLAMLAGVVVAKADSVAHAQALPAPQQAEVPTLVEVLTMLAGGVGVGGVIAFLFERFEWFQNLSGSARWWMIFGLSLGLPVVATLALKFIPADTWTALEPYWKALATGFVIWLGSQLAHRVNVGPR